MILPLTRNQTGRRPESNGLRFPLEQFPLRQIIMFEGGMTVRPVFDECGHHLNYRRLTPTEKKKVSDLADLWMIGYH